jgi:hypothetical protein
MLHLVVDRPIFGKATTDNIGSIRVLQKCGLKIIGKTKISPMAEAKTRKNTFFAWISIKQINAPLRIFPKFRSSARSPHVSSLTLEAKSCCADFCFPGMVFSRIFHPVSGAVSTHMLDSRSLFQGVRVWLLP